MQLKTKINLTITFFLLGIYTYAQTNKSVGIGTTTPNNSAVLHLESVNQGFMMPHLTNSQITAITSPMNGLIVYSTTDSCYWFYKASYWDKICGTQHIISSYISTDTLIANTATINTINADSIISNYINTHYIHSDTVKASYGNITYLTTDTFISNQATINNLNTDTILSNYIHSNTINTNTIIAGVGSFDTLLVNGQNINNVISNEIDSTAWLLKGNSWTNAAVNFLGTKDSVDLVFRTNNRERVRIKADSGNVGINTSAPTNDLDVNGGIRMRPGAALNYVMLSDAIGNGTWQNPVGTVITPGNLNNTAWDLIGNTGTNPAINFLGTSDSADVVFKTDNLERMRILANAGFIGINTPTPTNDLDINGGIRIRPGANLNYVLLSDANGNGTWQNPLTTILTYTTIGNYAWELLGNTGTNPSVNFLGSRDTASIVVRTDNIERMRILGANGYIGIGTSSPTNDLDINGELRMRGGLPATNNIMISSDNKGDARWSTGDSLFWRVGGNNNVTTPATQWFGNNNGSVYIKATTPFGRFTNNQNLVLFDGWALNDAGTRNSIIGGTSVTYTTNFTGCSGRTFDYNNFVLGSNISYTNAACYFNPNGNNFIMGNNISASWYGTNNVIFGTDLNLNSIIVTGGPDGSQNVIFADHLTTSGSGSLSDNVNTFIFGHSGDIKTYGSHQLANSFIVDLNVGSSLSNINALSSVVLSACDGNVTASVGDWVMAGYFSNGYTFYSNNIGTAGVTVAPGGGAWASVSDRNVKENINPVNSTDILNKLVSIKTDEWTYISQRPDDVNKFSKTPIHIGPMAQDFATAFGYGEYTDKITSSDIDGVMFVAIQALAEKQKNVEGLTSTVSDLKKQLEEMKSVIEEIKKK